MSDFYKAVAIILQHEGGWSNRSDDRGGPTNFGISLRWLQTIDPTATIDTIRKLTSDAAIRLYLDHWWDPFLYGQINDDTLATKVFDIAVPNGGKVAHLMLQNIVGSMPDGIMGPYTIAMTNLATPDWLTKQLCDASEARYRHIVAADPTQKSNLAGWLKRAAWPYSVEQP